ncbi:DUF3916 domain-containing protein [Ectopseudomonas mendocina]|uniref:DUF3916 domain-containing protein n=1 Tax=Ectopseudomonas mendocina TaxID=300 RepID=UPI0021B0FF1B|nr:DUF3916 domain-containing protein [Pseudomonas mendocina]
MARRLIVSKKPRGVARRLRALDRWAASFERNFPQDIPAGERYWNWKIPVLFSLVEGRHTNPQIQAHCAQALINACQHLMRAKPPEAENWRVTAVICLPDFFTSEVCLYLDEDYFQAHTRASVSAHGNSRHLAPLSLSETWSLQLVDGCGELGTEIDYLDEDQPDGRFIAQRWYFGEVMPR